EGEMAQDFAFHTKVTASAKLESDQTIPADEAAHMAKDFDVLFAAKDAYDTKMGDIDRDPAQADALIADAKSAVEKARDQAKSEVVKSELDTILKNHEEYAKYAREGADRFKEILNKPAADWQASDIDGKPVKLADFRGKVVVMDFWYRGCGWCMYAMPQVRK